MKALAIMEGSSHIYSEIFLHTTWHCHDNRLMIKSEIEPSLYKYIEEYFKKVKGIHFVKIGGTETHIHLVFQMEPFADLSDFIGKVKGSSSHEINKEFGSETIKWQRGYGIVSFAKKNLKAVVRYVENQKEHHKKGTINDILEEYCINYKKKID